MNRPTLFELSQTVQPLPEGVDMPTAIIAYAEPKMISGAILNTAYDLYAAGKSLSEQDEVAEAAEVAYEQTYLSSNVVSISRKKARRALEDALAKQQTASQGHQEAEISRELAKQVSEKSYDLAKPFRRTLMFIGAITLASGLLIGANVAADDINKKGYTNSPADQAALKSSVRNTRDVGEVFSITAGPLGGMLVGLLVAEKLEGRTARRRAKKIIKKASQ